MNDNLDTVLEEKRPALLEEERASMLQAIEEAIAAPVPSPYVSFLSSKIMTTLLLALILTVGASGTVLASDNAKPGDLLFPIERAREQTQLLLAGEAREAELRSQFTAERLAELREIISEEKISSDDDVSTSTDSSHVSVDGDGEMRISSAVQVLLDYLESVENTDERGRFLKELIIEIDAIKVAGRSDNGASFDDSRLRVEDDRIEIREDGYRIRIDDDGEVRIKADDDYQEDGSRNYGDDSRDDSSRSDSSSNASSFEAEADVFFDTTVVEVEINDRKTIFETSADTREKVIDEIVSRFGVREETVSAVLDFEVEDRTNRTDDSEDGDDDREDDSDDDSHSSDSDDDDYDDSEHRTGIEKFEVRVEDGLAEVRIEYGSQRKEYQSTYVSEEQIVVEAAGQTGLPIDALLAKLDLEIDS